MNVIVLILCLHITTFKEYFFKQILPLICVLGEEKVMKLQAYFQEGTIVCCLDGFTAQSTIFIYATN